jgi:maltooligosyltrehalose trehalohydrolase
VKWEVGLGACLGEEGTRFLVWAPHARTLELLLPSERRSVPMTRAENGYWEVEVPGIGTGTDYMLRLDGVQELPDPASHFQPRGVHGPSRVVDHRFEWHDQAWTGLPMPDYVIYELHGGTFAAEGTFDAIIPHLQYLKDLGVTAVELMPVAQFPGNRNWGYDGVYPYAVQDSYGGPDGLKRLVDAAHGLGLAVVLDVVYNHLGPEGNYLRLFGPYFTERYQTPWGAALNFDGEDSDEVRRFFIENALHWVRHYHIDGLRLDAVHAIVDPSATPFLEELAEAVHRLGENLGRDVQVIAESDLNDARIIRPREMGGFNMDAQWCDDVHHSLHALLTGERQGYYAGFGELGQVAKAVENGFVYTGEYAPHRRRRYGNSPGDLPGYKFVVATQNHDQVGNRMLGERLSQLVTFEALKLAAGAMLLSPFVPLIFMGEEYAEKAPFLFFVSHGDADLIEAVRKGRREEFRDFGWQGEGPDPASPDTFERSRLDLALRDRPGHAEVLELYRELLRLRREVPALRTLSRQHTEVEEDAEKRTLLLRRWSEGSGEAPGEPASQVVAVFNFSDEPRNVLLGSPRTEWRRCLDSADVRWKGPGAASPELIEDPASVEVQPLSFVLYRHYASLV